MKSLVKKLTTNVLAPLLIAGTLFTASPKIAKAEGGFDNPKMGLTYLTGSYMPNSSYIKETYGDQLWKNSAEIRADFPNNFRLKASLGGCGKEGPNTGRTQKKNLSLFQISATANYVFKASHESPSISAYIGGGINYISVNEKITSYFQSSGGSLSVDHIDESLETDFGFLMTIGGEIVTRGDFLLYLQTSLSSTGMARETNLGGVSLGMGLGF